MGDHRPASAVGRMHGLDCRSAWGTMHPLRTPGVLCRMANHTLLLLCAVTQHRQQAQPPPSHPTLWQTGANLDHDVTTCRNCCSAAM